MTTRRALVIGSSVLIYVLTLACMRPRLYPVCVFRSPASIRESLLTRTPLGSSRALVDKWLRSAGYPATVIDMRGSDDRSGYPTSLPSAYALIARMPWYYLPFRADTEAVYSFNQQGRLIGVEVHKSVDAL
jgi:hypothetical protein